MSSLPWIVRTNYRNRSLCYLLVFAAIASHIVGKGYSGTVWGLLAVQCFIYPHLLFLWVSRTVRPNRSELRNMEFDAVCCGAWSAGLGFPLWITFALFTGATLNLTAFRGIRGLALALLLTGLGALISLLTIGFQVQPDTDWRTTLLAIASVQLYTLLLAHGIFLRANMLRDARQQLRENESALQQANTALQKQLDENESLHARLRDQANRDPLTGLYNRRYLDSTMERELARCKREGHPLTLMLIDIDHFKSINDTYGHQAGDEVIKALANLLQTRASDVVCRYGGEEFLLLMPNIPQDVALERAEFHRKSFEASSIIFGEFRIQATLSTGIATYPGHGTSSEELLRCADQALYRAKLDGRNRVVLFDRDTASTP
jgi:diguanylate cyclase